MNCKIHKNKEELCQFYSGTDCCISMDDNMGSGNLADDKLYEALDRLYIRGWSDRDDKRGKDPRGTKEWQFLLDLFRVKG